MLRTSRNMAVLDRRSVLAGAALATLAGAPALSQTSPENEVVELWPNAPPGFQGASIARKTADQSSDPARPDRWISGIARPTLVVRRPARPNGLAVLIVPGGGYSFLSFDNEGTTQADWLVGRGMTAFILLYRLPSEGWHQRALVPLQDAQRAVRIIRGNHARFGVSSRQLAVLGFSAGGHLAGSLATRHQERTYGKIDALDDLSARPDVAGLIYPVVSLTAPFTHAGSRDMLLGAGAAQSARQAASLEHRVDAMTPPTLLVHAADDGLVPPANSIALFGALQAAGRTTALHVFEDGGHGFGNRLSAARSTSAWPDLFERFAIQHGLAA